LHPSEDEKIKIKRLELMPDFYNLSTAEEHLLWKYRY